MVSYINSLMYKQPQAPPYPGQWFPQNYQTNGSSFLQDSDGLPPQPMYYHPHAPIFQTSPDWQSHENYAHSQNSLLHASSGAAAAAAAAASLHQSSNNEHLSEGINSIPSPPATLCGSEISSPGAPNGASSPQTHNRPTPNKSPYSWIKKPSYQNQPNPGLINICSAPSLQDFTPLDSSGKTRTKDKYRVVYTDHQRLELEKEFHTARYITIRRKTELAQSLQLSERQVKIWFQNRRAKERKISKKRGDGSDNSNNCSNMNSSNMLGSNGMMCNSVMNGSPLMSQHGGNNSHNNNNALSCLLDTKPKLEPGLNLQHPLHQMNAMSMGMNAMNLHHSSLHSHLSVAPPPPVSAVQHLHQAAQRISSASGGSALSI